MNDPLFLRNGSYTALVSLFALFAATSAAANDPPQRISPRTVVPTPIPTAEDEAEEKAAAEAARPTPRPLRTPVQIKRVAPIVAAPTPAPASPQIRRATPVVTEPEAAPSPTPAAPRRKAPVITTPTPVMVPGTPQIRRATPVVTTPTPVAESPSPQIRRATPVVTAPPSVPPTGPAQLRRPSPVITSPTAVATPGDVRQRLPVITGPDTTPATPEGRRRPVVAADPVRQTVKPQPLRPEEQRLVPVGVIIPPPGTPEQTLAGSVTIHPGGYGELMRTLPPVRVLSLAEIRTNPMIKIGTMQVDFRPILNNPKSLVNIAARLRAIPDLVEVMADPLEATEVRQGLIVHNVLTYNFKRGACSDTGRRARIAAAGVNCFTKKSDIEREGLFANRADSHFIENAQVRQRAINAARTQRPQMDAEIEGDVAHFRSQLKDPSQRAGLAAVIGDSEVARLAGLDDTSLAGELMNDSETTVEQVAFVPRLSVEKAERAEPPPATPVTSDIDRNFDIGTFTYLTGFTLGNDYEWTQRVETTIRWCVLGCKKTYFAQLNAGFNYGFGLRFPIRLTGSYNYNVSSGVKKGTLTTNIATFNGSTADYAAAGLADKFLYSGKELVAQFGAHAAVAAKLPLVGGFSAPPLGVEFDFTKGLPAPFTDGQFTPPQPGSPSPSAPIIFDKFDLLGGRGNFGVLGGQIFPAVEVALTSQDLSLTLLDQNNGGKPTKLNTGTTSVPLTLGKLDAVDFDIGSPRYNLTFKVTPGLDARLFIDLAVWGTHWDWPVWFPQLAVELPPGGLDFACHDGTVCSNHFRFTPKGAQSQFMGQVESWGVDYDTLWVPKCLDDSCKFGIRLSRQSVIFTAQQQYDSNNVIDFKDMTPVFVDARNRALNIIADSQSRKSQELSNAMGILAQAIWAKQCKDSLCFDNITALTGQMGARGAEVGKANPELGTAAINQQVNKEFVPKFRKEIDDSALRATIAQSHAVAGQLKQVKQPKPIG